MSERHQLVRLAVVGVAWLIAMNLAIKYGGIWNSQANPTRGVTVQMRSGQVFEGTLNRSWDASWQLTSSETQKQITFDDEAYLSMSFTPPTNRPSWHAHWRAWGPVVAVCWACLIAILWPLRPQRMRTPALNKAL